MVGEVIQNIALVDSGNKTWISSNVQQLQSMISENNTISLDTKKIPRGTYFLHINYGDKKGGSSIIKSQVILE